MAREGHIPRDYGKEFGEEDIFELCHRLIGGIGYYPLSCDNDIDKVYQKLRFKNLLPYEKWIKSEFEVVYLNNTPDSSNIWNTSFLPRKAAE